MNLHLNYLWVAVVGVMCGAIISGHLSTVSVLAAQSGKDTLTVRKIIIVGKDGKPRATIGVEDDGAADIVLYDDSGARRVGLGTNGKGPKGKGGGAALNLFDESGKTIRNRLYVRDGDGSTGLTLNDRYGQPHAGYGIGALGSPASP